MNHEYQARLVWDGNTGAGTRSYSTYGREYHIAIAGKPDLRGTADPAFRGKPHLHNPEDLFLASVSACHMLTYLALCARQGVNVLSYEDDATGTLVTDRAGGGVFSEIILRPAVVVAEEESRSTAETLHDAAHEHCFIASSCRVPIHCRPTVSVHPDPGDRS